MKPSELSIELTKKQNDSTGFKSDSQSLSSQQKQDSPPVLASYDSASNKEVEDGLPSRISDEQVSRLNAIICKSFREQQSSKLKNNLILWQVNGLVIF